MPNLLTLKVKKELKDLTKNIKAFYGENLISLICFGSVVRGDIMIDSDVDLLIIIKESKLGLKKRIGEFYQNVGDRLSTTHLISPIILTQKEAKNFYAFYLGILEGFIILFDKDSFFKGVIGKIQSLKNEGYIEEYNLKGKKYWRIKNEGKVSERLSQ
jgi:predicted nucleotidyltransferase